MGIFWPLAVRWFPRPERKETILPKPHAYKDFMKLLDLCRIQAEADPNGVTENPHLYKILHSVYLRLCGGNVAENSIGEAKGAERERRLALIEFGRDMMEERRKV
jgi:hypothetical protein